MARTRSSSFFITDGSDALIDTIKDDASSLSLFSYQIITELAFSENIIRVVTVRAWKPGERVIVKSYHGSIQSRVRVIYCHHLAKARYAVGLELHSAVGTWVDVSQPPRAGV